MGTRSRRASRFLGNGFLAAMNLPAVSHLHTLVGTSHALGLRVKNTVVDSSPPKFPINKNSRIANKTAFLGAFE